MHRLFLSALLFLALFPSVVLARFSDEDLAAAEARSEKEGWTFTVGRNPATERPLSELCGLVEPDGWREGARFTNFEAKADVPEAFDWREAAGCPPIRDQSGCGSCWAFGTVGALECSILIKDGTVVDLSEQWLVSCNQETTPPVVVLSGTWGCNGGWWAHEYHLGTKTDPCGEWGAVLDADFPYEAENVPCDCPYPHAYAIDSWAYIGPEFGVPDVDAIKQAIFEYGPISASVCVDSTFAFYTGGVFNAGVIAPPNHAIVLVGWDDNQGENGIWILRNSWSGAWGELGYMRIEYGRSNVGYGACYVDYAGQGLGVGPEITCQPDGGYVAPGLMYEFTVAALGMGALHHNWRRDGESVGDDSPTVLVQNASLEDEGTYVCRVSDVRGTTVSNGAELRLYPEESLPVSRWTATGMLAVVCILGAKLLITKAR